MELHVYLAALLFIVVGLALFTAGWLLGRYTERDVWYRALHDTDWTGPGGLE
jgi:VIT1/CCC1 family predicted Fe2+/Mn2+ transporter